MIGHDSKTETPVVGLEEFFDSFILNRQNEIVAIRLGLSQLDFSILLKFAHQWKGYSSPYGFGLLEVFAIELEQFAHSAHLERCEHLLTQIEDYLRVKSLSR